MFKENSRELVLGTAMGYSYENLKPFIFSLKNSGFKGDLCLFVSKIYENTYRSLQKNGVKLIPFKEEYPYTTKLNIPDDLLSENLIYSKISVKYLRYILYYLYLLQNRSKYSKILIIDVRDVIFQRDPFDFNFDNGLCCFIEDSHVTIKDSPFNSVRIKRHFGVETLEKIGDNYPLCSGTIYGYFSDIMDYLKKMINLLSEIDTVGGGDQGLHNYLIYTEQFNDLKLYDNKSGPVFTFGTKITKSIRMNKKGSIINSKGDIFNIIHQYDRHPELFKRLSMHYKIKMSMKLPYPLIRIILTWKNRFENHRGLDFINHFVFKFANKFGLSDILDRWHLL